MRLQYDAIGWPSGSGENAPEKDSNDVADHYMIADGNNLIAEFMPDMVWKVPENPAYTAYWRWVNPKGIGIRDYVCGSTKSSKEERFVSLSYHSDWNRLMPVVEKISKIKLPEAANDFDTHHPTTFGMLNAETGRPMFRFYCCSVFEANTLIEAAWMACVDFIKLYKP